MGVRAPEMGRLPIAKTIEKLSGAGREGHHLLGQSLRLTFPLFADPFENPSHIEFYNSSHITYAYTTGVFLDPTYGAASKPWLL